MYNGSFGYDQKIPDNFREVFMWLCQDVAALHEKWSFYLVLFAKENTELLSELARASFQIIEESLRDDMTMSICRLSDHPQSWVQKEQKDNLSFPNLIKRLANPDSVNELYKNFIAACGPVREYRNKRVGHNDLDTTIKPKENPSSSRCPLQPNVYGGGWIMVS